MAKKDMTEKEAQYWGDYFMKNPPKTDPLKHGIFARRKANPFCRTQAVKKAGNSAEFGEFQ